jgi:hypothetical protein
MKMFSVMAVNLNEGSDYSAKTIGLAKSMKEAKEISNEYLKCEIAELNDQAGIEMFIDNTGLHAADEYGMYGIQISIQEIDINF